MIFLILCLVLLYVIMTRPSFAKADTDMLTFKTNATICDCGHGLIDTGRVAFVQIFTRNGTFTGKHLEFRSPFLLIFSLPYC